MGRLTRRRDREENQSPDIDELPNAQAVIPISNERPRDRFGRWITHSSRNVQIADSGVLPDDGSGVPSFAAIRDAAAKIGIPNWQARDDLTLMQMVAAHSVSVGVEGYPNARQNAHDILSTMSDISDCDLAGKLVQLGYSPKAAIAASVAAPLAA